MEKGRKILIRRWKRGEKSGEPKIGEKKRKGKKSCGKILVLDAKYAKIGKTARNFLSLPQKLEMFLKKTTQTKIFYLY